jgi:hypothetical protein
MSLPLVHVEGLPPNPVGSVGVLTARRIQGFRGARGATRVLRCGARAAWFVAILSSGALALGVVDGCSKNSPAPDLCPTAGTYLLTATIGGSYVMNTPTGLPLNDEGPGSCAVAKPSASCTPETLTISVTLDGAQSTNGEGAELQPIRWTSSTGESGSCTFVNDASSGLMTDGPNGTSIESTTCDLIAEGCTGSFDGFNMTFDLSGVYGNAIAAEVSGGGCCWLGTAAKQ